MGNGLSYNLPVKDEIERSLAHCARKIFQDFTKVISRYRAVEINFASNPVIIFSISSNYSHLRLLALTVGLGGVITRVDDQILWPVVKAPGVIAVQNRLDTVSVANLGVNRSTGHVRNHSITATPGVLSVAERVVLGCRLREPNVTTIASKVARLESFRNILLDNNGTTGSVDEPRA